MAAPSTKDAQWLPKAEAARFLNVSTRQIERYAEAGRLRSQLMRLEGDRTDRNIYALEDLERVKEQRDSPRAELAPWPKTPETPAIAALTAILQQTAKPPVTKAWLTLDDASHYSGLPAPEIARLVRKQKVYAIGRGAVTWRIQRESLDRWGESDHLHSGD
jgi:hypothetical protein